jgi:DNA polymerase I-like protein with 3'-5' exonuclease and polymerase domains
MLPIIEGRIYVIDIETKPRYEYDSYLNPNAIKPKEEVIDEDDYLEPSKVEEPTLLPWYSEIFGIGVAWGDDYESETAYFTGDDCIKLVEWLSVHSIPLAGHNILFDWLHLTYHYKRGLNFVSDSGVHSQCINNSDFIESYGLKQTTGRLYNVITQEVEIKNYLQEHYKIRGGKYGKYIYLCPEEIVSKYCRLDAHYSWRIINDSHKWLKSDISLYEKLYVNEAWMTIIQIINGIKVDREGFKKVYQELSKKITTIKSDFVSNNELIPYIDSILYNKYSDYVKTRQGMKTEKARSNILDFDVWKQNEDNCFNTNSTKQLKELFNKQGLYLDTNTGKFQYPYINNFPDTKTPNPDSPKLGTKFIHNYGIGGKILSDIGEKKTLLSHIERALNGSSFDGRVHPNINLLGTSSGRISASGMNIIAAPLSDPAYGKYLIADEGYEILMCDFSALEPTIFACLSNDPLLKYITYEGVGKEPFFKDGTLYIDDMYISAAYAAPFMKSELEDKLDLTNWVLNSSVEKKKVKQLRDLAKVIVLATNYGAGAEKIQQNINMDLKVLIPLKNIQQFQDAYWANISTAQQYKRQIELEAKRKGYLINIGGYPLTFYNYPGGVIQGEHKALNRMIQSSAAVCMKLLLYYIQELIKDRDDITPVICDIHDAFTCQIKLGTRDTITTLILAALEKVNNTLQLPLNLRLSFDFGDSLYDCKGG